MNTAICIRFPDATPVAAMARCPICRRVRRIQLWARSLTDYRGRRARQILNAEGFDYFNIACECGHPRMHWKEIVGRVVETVRCDARCTGAVGPSCDCSCGGKNHGAAWG